MSSNSNCSNDCADSSIFPKPIHNRPGLSHVDYSIGSYSDFRKELLKKLNEDDNFRVWTYRGSDDPGIALLDGVSILCDILTFYQELYANETFLRTAKWRESVAGLVKLLGYRLTPGVGAHATFAVQVKGDKSVIIPKGTQFKAQLEKLPQQTEFETTEDTTANPQLSKFKLYSPLVMPSEIKPETEFYISEEYQLKKGDRLMIGLPPSGAIDPGNPDRLKSAQIVFVDEVRKSHGQQLFKIKGSIENYLPSSQFIGYNLGRSFSHFGHNAPRTIVKVVDGKAQENLISYIRYVSYQTDAQDTPFQDEISTGNVVRIIDPTPLNKRDYPLETQVNDISIGNKLLIEGDFLADEYRRNHISRHLVFVRTITDIKSRSITWGSVSGLTSVVEFDELGNPSNDSDLNGTTDYDSVDIRNVQFYEVVGPRLTVNVSGIDLSGQGKQVNFYGDQSFANALRGRQLYIVKVMPPKTEIDVVNVTDVETSASPYTLTLDTSVDYANFSNNQDANIADIYGNLVCATQGKTQNETILGNGDNRQKFQSFKIPKSPLTYLLVAGASPPQVPELEIYVTGRLWERVSSFFDRGPNEQIYVVREDSNGDSWVQFGDGKTGVRLSSGVNNVTAIWRTGIGANGHLKEGTTVQLAGRVDRFDNVQLFTDSSGGSQQETGYHAKDSAPGKIQSLDRIVSLEDFETETLSIPGITKVLARWDLVGYVPGVVLTVLMDASQEQDFETVRKTISRYNICRGSHRFPISVIQGQFQDVHLEIKYALDPTFRQEVVENAIKEALGVTGQEANGLNGLKGLFGFAQRQFGQSEYSTRIEGVIQQVVGVIWVEASAFVLNRERFGPLYPIGLFENAHVPNQFYDPTLISKATLTCGRSQILRLQTGNLTLTRTSVRSMDACEDK